jgi:hypothetical protein
MINDLGQRVTARLASALVDPALSLNGKRLSSVLPPSSPACWQATLSDIDIVAVFNKKRQNGSYT